MKAKTVAIIEMVIGALVIAAAYFCPSDCHSGYSQIYNYYGGKGNWIRVQMIGGEPYITPNLKLSQPATLYEKIDGEWVEILTFTQVLDGKAS